MLVCVATVLAWPLSYARPIGKSRATALTVLTYGLGNGRVWISTLEKVTPNPSVATAAFHGYPYGAQIGEWGALGFHWRRERMTLQRPTDRTVVMVLSRSSTFSIWLWVPLLLSAVLPTWRLIREWLITRKRPEGSCRVCGYDLRASSVRCPECGTPIRATP